MSKPAPADVRLAESGVLLPHEAVAAVLALPNAQWVADAQSEPTESVFAAGVLLAELLAGVGSPLAGRPASPDAVERRFHELPEDWGRNLDEPLQAQISKALDPDPGQRFADVEGFRAALEGWSGTAAGRTIETLLARMQRQGDFPALADAMGRILKVASSDDDSLEDLAREVLKDVALTQQLLRLVNSAHYAQVSGMVSTVSRAVGLVGFNGVRNLALGVRLLERMPDQGHASQLKSQFLRALMAGSVAAELCAVAHLREDAFLGAMFQNLGRLLVGFYFPAQASQIAEAVAEGRYAGGESTAAIHALGLSLEDFGTGVARSWGLPADLLHCMRRPFGRPPVRRPNNSRDYLRWLAVAANDITTALMEPGPAEAALEPAARVKAVTELYARVLGLDPEDFSGAVEHAKSRSSALAQAMGFPDGLVRVKPAIKPALPAAAPPGSCGTRPAAPMVAGAIAVLPRDSAAAPLRPQPTRPPGAEAGTAAMPDRTARMAGQHEALRALSDQLKAELNSTRALADLLRLAVAALESGLHAQRVVFCLREAGAAPPNLSARHAVGADAHEVRQVFRLELREAGDLLGAACRQGAQSVIDNALEPAVQARLPKWLRERLRPGAFWLLPLVHRDAPFALLYADVAEPGALLLDPGSRELLKKIGELLVQLFMTRQQRTDKTA
jgi:HD-like signal output (HDOD) protein